MRSIMKTAQIHINANSDKVECIGYVSATSTEELKKKARQHARSWNKHRFGRLCLTLDGKDIFINPNI